MVHTNTPDLHKLTCKHKYYTLLHATCSLHSITPEHFNACARRCMFHWGESPAMWARWVDAAHSVQGDFDVILGRILPTCKGE